MKEASIVEIERKAMALIDRFRKEAGLSEAKLGELAFPEAKNYRQKINSLRNARGSGNEPLRLRLGDFALFVMRWERTPHKSFYSCGEADKENS
ncbi:MAG: hypothetical protein ACLR7Z_16870 [Bilophila wadsworthia]